VQGLLRDGLDNKSIERIAEADTRNYFSLQHFISESTWKSQSLFTYTASGVNTLIGGNDAALVFDESGMLKAGKHSVGVARQYIGSAGKVDNGQVGVFAAIASNEDYCIIDAELYLPQSWCDDPKRLEKAGVPEEFKKYRPVTEIALAIHKRVKDSGVQYGFVTSDASYGKNLDFSWKIAASGDVFMTDIDCATRVYLDKPSFAVPEYSGRGRKPTREKADIESTRVDEIAKDARKREWKRITVRGGTKGPVIYKYLFLRPWFYNTQDNQWEKLHLIIRCDIETGELKYSVSNATHTVKKKRLAYMQAQRFWVERSFQDAKNSVGMADYQVRGWRAWHHHMALVSFAMYFVLSEKLGARKSLPLLSFNDITEVITVMVSQKVTYEEAMRRIRARHRQRHSDIVSSYRRRSVHRDGRRMCVTLARMAK
jgi:SRSO17 transposase